MKNYTFILLAVTSPFVFSNCSFSVKTQKPATTEQVRTTTQKTTTTRPNSTTVETQTSRSSY